MALVWQPTYRPIYVEVKGYMDDESKKKIEKFGQELIVLTNIPADHKEYFDQYCLYHKMDFREKLVELLHKGVRCPGVIDNCGDCPHHSLQNPCDELVQPLICLSPTA